MGMQPNDPIHDYGQGYPSPPQGPQGLESNDGRGLALAGLILGIIALVLFWLPLINFVSLLLALVGLGLSIASLVIVRRRGSAQALSVAAVVVSAVALVAAIIATVLWSALFNAVDEEVDTPLSPVTAPVTVTATPAPADTSTATPTPTSGQGQTSEAPAFPGAENADVVGLAGEALVLGDVTVTSTPLTDGDSTLRPTLCTTATLQNNSDETIDFNIFDWKLQSPSGTIRNSTVVGSDNSLSSGEVAPGGTATGDVCFNDPAETGQFVVLYEPVFSFFSDRGAWINDL
ncbi:MULTISPECIES: DUF4352 domain-containing protein [unclassified Arthrobacter]|uniref:DUF4352 domain-containing protein n=1 Tax=unclassified Arthrobacter TaxID=235627 RepID=UPI0015E24C59|nr:MULTISPECIES: DUF4352 domain-containing protein [unclassified Arthrobacter]